MSKQIVYTNTRHAISYNIIQATAYHIIDRKHITNVPNPSNMSKGQRKMYLQSVDVCCVAKCDQWSKEKVVRLDNLVYWIYECFWDRLKGEA